MKKEIALASGLLMATAIVVAALVGCGDEARKSTSDSILPNASRSIPPIDAALTSSTKTATFALG